MSNNFCRFAVSIPIWVGIATVLYLLVGTTLFEPVRFSKKYFSIVMVILMVIHG